MAREFMDGRRGTPKEYAASVLYKGKRCAVCPNRPIMEAVTFMPLDELFKRDPQAAALSQRDPSGFMKTVVKFRMTDGSEAPFVKYATAYSCSQHKKELAQAAAKAPSFCVVEMREGPADAPIMKGWTSELANVDSVATRTTEPAGQVRVNDRRHASENRG